MHLYWLWKKNNELQAKQLIDLEQWHFHVNRSVQTSYVSRMFQARLQRRLIRRFQSRGYFEHGRHVVLCKNRPETDLKTVISTCYRRCTAVLMSVSIECVTKTYISSALSSTHFLSQQLSDTRAAKVYWQKTNGEYFDNQLIVQSYFRKKCKS